MYIYVYSINVQYTICYCVVHIAPELRYPSDLRYAIRLSFSGNALENKCYF